ncbi:MAG: GDSL-type esterase/lipase family protein [archaeon]
MARICVFGSSTVSDEYFLGFDCWVSKLREFVGDMSVFNLGISGDDMVKLLERMDGECTARNPDIIIIRNGSNDAKLVDDKPACSLETFKENMRKAITIAEQYTEEVFIVGNHPVNEAKTNPAVWDVHERWTNDNLRAFNEAMRTICAEEDLIFIDVFDEWSRQDYQHLLDDEDGLHLSEQGHQLLFDIIKAALAEQKLI